MRLFAVSALALATLATPAFAQEATGPFSGARAEVVAGWDHVGGLGEGASGVAYGGAFGFDAQVKRAVIGVEAEATGATTDEDIVNAGRDLYIGARFGYTVTDTTLVYAKGGYTNARVNVDGFDGEDLEGYRFGAGVEQNFGRFYGKVEYRYSRYEEANLNRDQVMAGLGIRF
jgi:outer membrane immunogenic protein